MPQEPKKLENLSTNQKPMPTLNSAPPKVKTKITVKMIVGMVIGVAVAVGIGAVILFGVIAIPESKTVTFDAQKMNAKFTEKNSGVGNISLEKEAEEVDASNKPIEFTGWSLDTNGYTKNFKEAAGDVEKLKSGGSQDLNLTKTSLSDPELCQKISDTVGWTLKNSSIDFTAYTNLQDPNEAKNPYNIYSENLSNMPKINIAYADGTVLSNDEIGSLRIQWVSSNPEIMLVYLPKFDSLSLDTPLLFPIYPGKAKVMASFCGKEYVSGDIEVKADGYEKFNPYGKLDTRFMRSRAKSSLFTQKGDFQLSDSQAENSCIDKVELTPELFSYYGALTGADISGGGLSPYILADKDGKVVWYKGEKNDANVMVFDNLSPAGTCLKNFKLANVFASNAGDLYNYRYIWDTEKKKYQITKIDNPYIVSNSNSPSQNPNNFGVGRTDLNYKPEILNKGISTLFLVDRSDRNVARRIFAYHKESSLGGNLGDTNEPMYLHVGEAEAFTVVGEKCPNGKVKYDNSKNESGCWAGGTWKLDTELCSQGNHFEELDVTTGTIGCPATGDDIATHPSDEVCEGAPVLTLENGDKGCYVGAQWKSEDVIFNELGCTEKNWVIEDGKQGCYKNTFHNKLDPKINHPWLVTEEHVQKNVDSTYKVQINESWDDPAIIDNVPYQTVAFSDNKIPLFVGDENSFQTAVSLNCKDCDNNQGGYLAKDVITSSVKPVAPAGFARIEVPDGDWYPQDWDTKNKNYLNKWYSDDGKLEGDFYKPISALILPQGDPILKNLEVKAFFRGKEDTDKDLVLNEDETVVAEVSADPLLNNMAIYYCFLNQCLPGGGIFYYPAGEDKPQEEQEKDNADVGQKTNEAVKESETATGAFAIKDTVIQPRLHNRMVLKWKTDDAVVRGALDKVKEGKASAFQVDFLKFKYDQIKGKNLKVIAALLGVPITVPILTSDVSLAKEVSLNEEFKFKIGDEEIGMTVAKAEFKSEAEGYALDFLINGQNTLNNVPLGQVLSTWEKKVVMPSAKEYYFKIPTSDGQKFNIQVSLATPFPPAATLEPTLGEQIVLNLAEKVWYNPKTDEFYTVLQGLAGGDLYNVNSEELFNGHALFAGQIVQIEGDKETRIAEIVTKDKDGKETKLKTFPLITYNRMQDILYLYHLIFGKEETVDVAGNDNPNACAGGRCEGAKFWYDTSLGIPGIKYSIIHDPLGEFKARFERTVSEKGSLWGVERLFSTIHDRIYAEDLEKVADPEGMNYWRKQIDNKKINLDGVVEYFFLSPEYNKDLIATMGLEKTLAAWSYLVTLGRPGVEKDLDYLKGKFGLNSKEMRHELLGAYVEKTVDKKTGKTEKFFQFTDEPKKRLEKIDKEAGRDEALGALYLGVFGRPIDPAGLKHYKNKMEKDDMTFDQVAQDLFESKEFKKFGEPVFQKEELEKGL